MKYSYYPGCTLKNKAKDLDIYTRASAAALGIELEEIENWQCCGGVYPLGTDEIATKLSSVRVLNAAKEKARVIIGQAEDRSRHLYQVANEYAEDVMSRTEEAVQAALDEVKQSRLRFRAASAEKMQEQRSKLEAHPAPEVEK